MFSDGIDFILYLKPKALNLYNMGNGQSGVLKFPDNVVSNQEIIDQKSFLKLLQNFLDGLNFNRKKLLIILSKDLTFPKKLTLKNTAELDRLKQKFFDELPFNPEDITKIELTLNGELFIIAVNKSFYQQIVDFFNLLDAKIIGVVPAVLYGERLSRDINLTAEEIEFIQKNNDIAKNGDLLTLGTSLSIQTTNKVFSSDLDSENDPEKEQQGKRKIAIVLIILFILAIVAALFYFRLVNIPFLQTFPNKMVISTASPVATIQPKQASASAKISTPSGQISKDQIKVMVINGTGLSGQAGRTKELLEGLGYTDIELGNKQSTDTAKTTILYSGSIGQYLINEMVLNLRKLFKLVTAELGIPNKVDLQITTGEYIK